MMTPAATVQTRAGRAAYGPKCAKAMGIMPGNTSARRKRAKKVPANIAADYRQFDWLEVDA